MKAYLANKFKEDNSNREEIESISMILREIGIETVSMIRDYEKWGEIKFIPSELMTKSFKEIDSSDLLIIEFSEKGVGLGIEAGYAYAKQKPIFVIAKNGSDISSTLIGIAKKIYFYDKPEDILEMKFN